MVMGTVLIRRISARKTMENMGLCPPTGYPCLLRWNSACKTMENMELCPPTGYPCLLLAEDTGEDSSALKVTELEASRSIVDHIHGYYDLSKEDGVEDKEKTEVDRIICDISDLFKNPSSIRGFFSLATQKIYNLDLPEAMDKVILGTNKGWLVTLGRDLEINLLHPLLRHQIPLPPMLTFPSQYEYDDDFSPQNVYKMFVSKVVMSSNVPTEESSRDTVDLPIIMAIFGEYRRLGFARLGDKLWKEVETSRTFDDIVYHKEKFYAVDWNGAVFMCDINDKTKRHKGTNITSIPIDKDCWVQGYLIESLSGSHIWVVLRFRKGEYYKKGCKPLTPGKLRYYTSGFVVLSLEIQYTDSDDIPSCTWTTNNVKDLGEEALFIGRNSSVSVASSEFIKPNSIYFTDDMSELYCTVGVGNDMGIFNIKTGTIEPHFPWLSIHPYSPAVWYI